MRVGNLFHLTPCTLSRFWSSERTSSRKPAKVVMDLCQIGLAELMMVLMAVVS